jgi:dihydrofolate reductase/thymidylate synthase
MVAALDCKLGIGRNGQLPWHLPPDLQYFHDLTERSIVIMGRKTWESIPAEHRPLLKRLNIVISRNQNLMTGDDLGERVLLGHSFEQGLEFAQEGTQTQARIFVIGGGEIYRQAIVHPDCTELFLTHIDAEFNCDTFFPLYENQFELESSDDIKTYKGLQFVFSKYKRRQA